MVFQVWYIQWNYDVSTLIYLMELCLKYGTYKNLRVFK